MPNTAEASATVEDTKEWSSDRKEDSQPFFISIDRRDGLITALQKLDAKLRAANKSGVISKKAPTDWIGREVTPGQLGLINHGGLPKLLTRAGRYPGMPLRNWWAREWCGLTALSDAVIEFQGLTVVQVSQNQVAVVSDPQNRIFAIKDSGFVAFAVEGTYDVLSIVDQTHLDCAVVDERTKVPLGWTHEVKQRSKIGARDWKESVVATFLNIPAQNCAILQNGNDLELLQAGQHCITDPNVTLRGFYTLCENQVKMPTEEVFTRDQVPVSLNVYLRLQLQEPLKLTTHGYNTPYDALREKTQVILTEIAARLYYGAIDDGTDASTAFLDSLRPHAMEDLRLAALEYGIVLKDLTVVHRQSKDLHYLKQPGIDKVLEELARQHLEQCVLLDQIAENGRTDSIRNRDETLKAIRETAQEQVKLNIQDHLDGFSKSLAGEVRSLLSGTGNLRTEKQKLERI